MRGQREVKRGGVYLGRIIPARAGPTRRRTRFRPRLPDHPRSCGANSRASPQASCPHGSSPLVRGQLEWLADVWKKSRIIPARAGPTDDGRVVLSVDTDHPRSCGANPPPPESLACSSGSSPLVRGQLLVGLADGAAGRIIPARAGPTWNGDIPFPLSSDHPRSCGANDPCVIPCRAFDGSSPLVRGQQSDFTRKKRVESNKNI